jgi:hypothetical protein
VPERPVSLASPQGNVVGPIAPICVYLGGRTFDPKTFENMSVAFKGVCDALGLKPVNDAVTRLGANSTLAIISNVGPRRAFNFEPNEIKITAPLAALPAMAPIPFRGSGTIVASQRQWLTWRLKRSAPAR